LPLMAIPVPTRDSPCFTAIPVLEVAKTAGIEPLIDLLVKPRKPTDLTNRVRTLHATVTVTAAVAVAVAVPVPVRTRAGIAASVELDQGNGRKRNSNHDSHIHCPPRWL
jgi:hypothetical protein